MDDCVGIAEAAPERVTDRDAGDLAAVDRIHHDELVGVNGAAPCAFADAQRIERREAVRTELQSGADLADLRPTARRHRRQSRAWLQRERGRHAADAAANDEHRG